MPAIALDARALEDYLPHRGVNLIADQVTLQDGGKQAIATTRLTLPDPRGREALGRRDASGAAFWYEPFLGELMALTGLPLLHERLAAAGQVSVFSMISKLVFHRLAPLGGEIVGQATITRDRGTFTGFQTSATVDGQPLLEAEVMSGTATLAEISGSAKAVDEPLPAGEAIPEAWFAWKPAHLRFATTIVAEDAAAGRLVTGYHYGKDHPFVPGHFPGGPLMMGVTQWAAIADAAWAARCRFGLTGTIIANGVMKRPDGREVMDVRDLELADEGGVPRITSTKRIAFRDKVVPGESVLVEVTVGTRP